jgi:hypothetical protein
LTRLLLLLHAVLLQTVYPGLMRIDKIRDTVRNRRGAVAIAVAVVVVLASRGPLAIGFLASHGGQWPGSKQILLGVLKELMNDEFLFE